MSIKFDKVPAKTDPDNSVRAELLGGLASDRDISDALGLSLFTVRYRLQLPCIRVGVKRFYDIGKCRALLLAQHEAKHQTPRPGRPRKVI